MLALEGMLQALGVEGHGTYALTFDIEGKDVVKQFPVGYISTCTRDTKAYSVKIKSNSNTALFTKCKAVVIIINMHCFELFCQKIARSRVASEDTLQRMVKSQIESDTGLTDAGFPGR